MDVWRRATIYGEFNVNPFWQIIESKDIPECIGTADSDEVGENQWILDAITKEIESRDLGERLEKLAFAC
jgi:hypothetical protein